LTDYTLPSFVDCALCAIIILANEVLKPDAAPATVEGQFAKMTKYLKMMEEHVICQASRENMCKLHLATAEIVNHLEN
jgi:hypothetical protein